VLQIAVHRCNELQLVAAFGDKPVRPLYAHLVGLIDNESRRKSAKQSINGWAGDAFFEQVGPRVPPAAK
jgi:hypothetical protein